MYCAPSEDSSALCEHVTYTGSLLRLSLSHIMNGSYSLLTEMVGALVLEPLHSMHLGRL